MSKPFLKWAGGKYTQLADLFRFIPEGKRLIEPFVGGGSVFLNSGKHADFLLADVIPDLINLDQMLAVVLDAVEYQARWMFEKMANPDGYELITGTSITSNHAFSQARFTAKGVRWIGGLWTEYKAGGNAA